ncbi:5-formyltetrahydrofolate cyclo-ligase, mitochondrial-like isoform X1 [Quercus lobata]|uniref:5-formyltetrahydrofolate cyclo-ligase n=1 Tax=Quercus lobata TaxID=97700 RepID=A0A7N2LC47_QUELO|nr:5-formyltetrahydrofolate cyclo-ligase, mitochondrial-like isoform X1 [Quercus lobata]XP_030956372.1 5-formyltetrahydrofolate cyclo-ligase, mitochondrial-like isoform X1 [Quercus lobata]
MFCHYTARAGRQMISSAKQVVMLTQARTLASPPTPLSSHPTNVRLVPEPNRSFVTMTTNNDDPHEVDAIFQRKHSLRSKLRKDLKNMDPIRRSEEDNAIQSIVLEAPWFKASKSLCAYISCAALREVDTSRIVSQVLSKPTQEQKKLYVPRVEDRNSNMRMLKISSVDDLIINSMNILEPSLVDCDGKQREDVMEASNPVDLFILPGLAFDRSGRRLGRSGGYYDLFLKKYQELAKQRKWKQPLLVALSYSLQIVDEGAIAVTSNDISVDALVSPAGFIPMSPAALDRG